MNSWEKEENVSDLLKIIFNKSDIAICWKLFSTNRCTCVTPFWRPIWRDKGRDLQIKSQITTKDSDLRFVLSMISTGFRCLDVKCVFESWNQDQARFIWYYFLSRPWVDVTKKLPAWCSQSENPSPQTWIYIDCRHHQSSSQTSDIQWTSSSQSPLPTM